MSTRCSPKIVAFDELVDEVEDDEGRSLRTEWTNATNAAEVSVRSGNQVVNAEDRSVWYAVVRTSTQLGSDRLQ